MAVLHSSCCVSVGSSAGSDLNVRAGLRAEPPSADRGRKMCEMYIQRLLRESTLSSVT